MLPILSHFPLLSSSLFHRKSFEALPIILTSHIQLFLGQVKSHWPTPLVHATSRILLSQVMLIVMQPLPSWALSLDSCLGWCNSYCTVTWVLPLPFQLCFPFPIVSFLLSFLVLHFPPLFPLPLRSHYCRTTCKYCLQVSRSI